MKMNSSFNVCPTSVSSEVNHSSSSFHTEQQNALNNIQNSYQINPSSYQLMTNNSPMMPVPSPSGQGVQQQNSSPNSPASYDVNTMNAHLPVTISSSQIAQTPATPSSPQMKYQMVPSPNTTTNSSFTVQNPTITSPPSQMNNSMMHSPNLAAPNSPQDSNPTPSSQMNNHVQSPHFASNNSSSASIGYHDYPTPPPSQMNNHVQSPHFANNSSPNASMSYFDLPPLTPLLPTPASYFSTPFDTYLNSKGNIPLTLKDPPPYPTAVQHNQSETTYTELSSLQPFNLANSFTPAVTSASSLYQSTGLSLGNLLELPVKDCTMPELIYTDEGIGTSPETSPGHQSRNSPGMAYADDSINTPFKVSVPAQQFFPQIQPKLEPRETCSTCGSLMTDKNGQYQCETCSEKKQTKPPKKKKKAVTACRKEGNLCANCGTVVTTLWRRDPDGNPLCNACGLYLKLHGYSRPKSMRKDKVQKRNRKPRNNSATKRGPQPSPGNRSAPAATVLNNCTIPYTPPTSNAVQPQIYFTPTSNAADSSPSYQISSFTLQNMNSSFMFHNNTAFGENNNPNMQYSMMQLT